jgi:hypothetical protein
MTKLINTFRDFAKRLICKWNLNSITSIIIKLPLLRFLHYIAVTFLHFNILRFRFWKRLFEGKGRDLFFLNRQTRSFQRNFQITISKKTHTLIHRSANPRMIRHCNIITFNTRNPLSNYGFYLPYDTVHKRFRFKEALGVQFQEIYICMRVLYIYVLYIYKIYIYNIYIPVRAKQ